MAIWPFGSRDKGSPQAQLRDMDISIDDYAATYLNYDGNTYPVAVFGGDNGAWQFGGYAPYSGGFGDEEISNDDFESMVGGIYKASTPVFVCHNYRRSLFSEVRFTFQEISKTGRPGDFVDDPELSILRNPWPGATSRDLLTRAIMYADMGGNAFLVRDTINGVDQIRFLRPDWTMILMSGDPTIEETVAPEALIYKPGRTENVDKWKIYPFDGSNGRVAHWAPIPDPHAFYRGMSWLTPIIREAITDKAIGQQKLRFFQNGARPGIVASFDPSVSPEQAAEFQEKFLQTKTGATNAYKPLFIGGGCSITALDVKMDDFELLNAVGELRIAAAAGVPAVVSGLGMEAMKGSSTAFQQGNYQAAKDMLGQGTMHPLWGSFCEAIMPLLDSPSDSRLWYDPKGIAFLQDDVQAATERKQSDAATLNSYLTAGFTPESSIQALLHDNIELLEHSGLYSVQLIPPGMGHMGDFTGDDPAESQGPQATGKPSATPKKPNPGQQSKDET